MEGIHTSAEGSKTNENVLSDALNELLRNARIINNLALAHADRLSDEERGQIEVLNNELKNA